MKKVFFVVAVFALLFSNVAVMGQAITAVDVTVKDRKLKMTGISVSSDAELQSLQSAWATYLKKTLKLKVKSGRDEVTAEAALIPAVSTTPFDLTTTYKATASGCEMIVTACAANEICFSPSEHPQDYSNLKVLVTNFVKNYMAANYSNLIKEKQQAIKAFDKELSDMEKEVKSLEKANEKAAKSIEAMQKQVQDNEASIKSNKEKLPEMKKTLDQKKALLKELEAKMKNISGK
jgi:valyl-tRNA synthetase